METSILNTAVPLKAAIQDEKVFGCWILKDRIIPVYEDENHPEYAIKILNELFNINNEKRESGSYQYTRRYSLYRIMYRLGFIRLTIYNPGYLTVEFASNLKPTEFQQRLINKADYIAMIDLYVVK